jgi:hypothetical protein
MSHRSHRIPRAAFCEPLEPRRMLATFDASVLEDVINISGTSSITHVKINGTDNTTTDASIHINCLSGNDRVIVSSMRPGTTILVNGDEGNDQVSNDLWDLDAVFPGNFTFDGGEGEDDFAAENLFDSTTPATITIQGNAIVKDGHILLDYRNIEDVFFGDSNGSNRIEFINLQNGFDTEIQRLTIDGNDGNDLIVNHRTVTTGGHFPTSMAAVELALRGNNGTDTLVLDDSLSNAGTQFDVSSTSVDFAQPGLGTVEYRNFETLDIVGSTSGDLVTLNSTLATMSLQIEPFDGNDSVTVGGGAINSNGFTISNTTIFGGGGSNSIRFDDHLNTAGELYTFNNFTLAAGTGGVTYGGFETQMLDLANGALPAEFDPTNNVNVNAISGQIASTTINGGITHVQLVNVGNGNLTNVSGSLTLNLAYRPVNALNVNDQNGTGTTSSYEVNNVQVLKTSAGQTINYSGVGQMTLNTRDSTTVGDVINVKSTPAGMSLTVNAGAGGDNLFFGNGNIDANLLGPITLNAGTGTDFGGINNSLDTTVETMTLNATSLIDSGVTYSFTGFDGTINFNLGPGGTNLTINGTQCNTNINGTAANEIVTVGGGDIDANFAATVGKGLFLDVQGGTNTLRIDDTNDTNVDLYIFQQAQGLDQFVKRDGANENYITWQGMSSVTLDASNAPASGVSVSTILVNAVGTPLRINGNGGPDSVQVADAFSPVTVNTGLGDLDSLSVNSDFDLSFATVVIDQSDDIENLSIFNGGTVRVTSGAVLLKTRLGLNPSLTINGELDLAGGAFLSRAGGPTPAQFRAQIIAGRNGGTWNGTSASGAINSSLAASTPRGDGVGYGLGSDVAVSSIGGFTIAPGDTILRYTLEGDTDLNQQVNLIDFNRLSANFGQTNRVWTNGDSNYDGTVNLADFNALSANFGSTVTSSPLVFSRRPITASDDRPDSRWLLEEFS